MPIRGGTSDKLGNRYEILWAIDRLIEIVEGRARGIVLEAIEPHESSGVEFAVRMADNTNWYWSIKRQTVKAAGWTLATLTSKDEKGRSILGDLFSHLNRDLMNRAIFASTLGARDLEELRRYSATDEMLHSRLQQSLELRSGFDTYVVPLTGNAQKSREFVERTEVRVIDEQQLLERIDVNLRKLFYQDGAISIDPAALRGLLSEFLLNSLHTEINRAAVLERLHSAGFRLRDWAIEPTVTTRIHQLIENYVIPLKSDLISGEYLAVRGSEQILGGDGVPKVSKLLVSGGAGSGKSSTLAQIVQNLEIRGIAVLPIRFDQLPEGVLSTTELGRKLLLPESPALVLAGVAAGKPSVLVIDQLDAISIASGRRSELWNLFDQLRREAERLPAMNVVVGCRAFDLEHDHRMRAMTKGASAFEVVKLQNLTDEQVKEAIKAANVPLPSINEKFMSILQVPLHLSMFLSLDSPSRSNVQSRDMLFERFWEAGERRTDSRLGRKSLWTLVIDRLIQWLSTNQQLSAPKHVLDDYSVDASAMASEHILVFNDGRYRFFHETFFDYAFARRFAVRGASLVSLLLSSEQHLFRRAQTRQILAYLRGHDWGRYLLEAEQLLLEPGVRYHLKRLLLQWLSSLDDPQIEEWKMLERVLAKSPGLHVHIRGSIANHPGWFDVLDQAGFFDQGLSSIDKAKREEIIWMFAFHKTLESRSHRIAGLLQKHREPGEEWNGYLRHICRFGHVYHSREMFDLFLSLIADGTLDGTRPGFAMNDTWWTLLYSMAEDRPELVCEVIGTGFDRSLESSKLDHDDDNLLRSHINRGGDGSNIIYKAAKTAPLRYVQEMLPRVAKFVKQTARNVPGRLKSDPLWSMRGYGDDRLQTSDALLSALALALETISKSSPHELDDALRPYVNSDEDTVSYLLLRAWSAAPEYYADNIADYLVADGRRLKVGYASWGGRGGSGESLTSRRAIKSATPTCSQDRLISLEKCILSLQDDWENKNPRIRGLKQLALLRAFDRSRLSHDARKKLQELERKFPSLEDKESERMEVSYIGSPVPESAQAKMSDEQWLSAMRKYDGAEESRSKDGGLSGGEYQLAISLSARAKEDPVRFALLAERMDDRLASSYFDAILRGITEASANFTISIRQVAKLIERTHRLPDRPCGRAICDLVAKKEGAEWPSTVADAVVWYAVRDPDPTDDLWKKESGGGGRYYAGDPYTAGINSTRGTAAGALGMLIHAAKELSAEFRNATYSLCHDSCVSVRSCAVSALLAMTKFDASTAQEWFLETTTADECLLAMPLADRFIRVRGFEDYSGLRETLSKMMNSSNEELNRLAALHTCVFGLTNDVARLDAASVRVGSKHMRKAAAEVYARNVAHGEVGIECRQLLRSFFSDPDPEVRAEAASAFQFIASLQTPEQAELLESLISASPQPDMDTLEPIIRSLEDSPVSLPELVCKLAAMSVEAYRADAGDVSKAGAIAGMDLSKIVIRLYAQSNDDQTRSKCLDLIDDMERYNFMGMSDELQRLER